MRGFWMFSLKFTFHRNNINFLEQEFKYWQDNHNIVVCKNNKSYHNMFRYNCEDDGPRPESYFEDYTV